jgi:hypothetical protein
MYQDTFRHEKPVVEIHTAEPLSYIPLGDYLYKSVFQIRWWSSRSYFAGGGKAA